MKVAVVQFDNRSAQDLGVLTWLMRRNAAYAQARGYDYHFFDQVYFDLPVYWQKPSLCRRVLELGYDLVLWLDTDAVVHDTGRRVEALFEGAEAMVGAPDNPHWTAPFNAGVFAVRGAQGQALLQRWADLFAGTAWRRTDTAWICDTEWAGPDYEQGAFNARLLPDLTASGQLRLTDWRILQGAAAQPEAFTLHFAGPLKAKVPAYLQMT